MNWDDVRPGIAKQDGCVIECCRDHVTVSGACSSNICDESADYGDKWYINLPLSSSHSKRVGTLGPSVGFYRLRRESGSRVARMPTHAMRLHEWGTQGIGEFNVWATRRMASS